MIKRKVKTLGFELMWLVPETVEEYNALAPKRLDPALEDSINSTWYRSGAPKVRDAACALFADVTGIERVNSGTEDKPVWEQEGKFRNRAFVAWATKNGLDPAANDTETKFVAALQDQMQAITDKVPCDPSEREATGTSPSVSKAATQLATESFNKGMGATVASNLARLLGRPVPLTGTAESDIPTLAKAIAEYEKRKREEQAARSRDELGLGAPATSAAS